MKKSIGNLTPRIVTVILFVSTIVIVGIPLPTGLAYQAQKITEIVSYPLPSLPEPVLLGGALKVDVNAGPDASGWTASLTSKYGSSSIGLINSSYTGSDWILFFNVPEEIHPELYDLGLTYSEGGESVDYTQSKCVWVLEEWPETLTISHITDMHQPHGRNVFAQNIHEVNLIDPDMIIITGDTVQTETVASGWNYLQGTMQRIEIPCFLLPGNHDYSGKGGKLYQVYGGKLNYTVVIGDFLFVALDSSAAGYFSDAQLSWAESVLQRYPDKVKILGFHHPLLSSEYEDDFGTVKGGAITGSWENIEDMVELMYFTWLIDGQPREVAKELLRIIQENDVRLILAGHVHRDMIYILNNQNYFVTTSTAGGGLPPGSQYGSRLITVDTSGNVQLDDYAVRGLYEPPNSIPTGNIKYWFKKANDGSQTAVTAQVFNNLNMSLDSAKLEFAVSAENPVEDYSFSGLTPTQVETHTNSGVHRFVAYFNIPPLSFSNVTLSASGDENNPMIEIDVSDYGEEGPVKATIEVTDAGWGTKEISASYSIDNGATWTPFELIFSPIISGDEYVIEYPVDRYEVSVAEDLEFDELIIMTTASDFAGNEETVQMTISSTPPPPLTPTYTLSVDSDPVSGISFNVDGQSLITPYSEIFDEGTYTLTLPQNATISGKDYTFKDWSDGVTSMTRTLELESDMSLTAIYEEVQVEEPEEESHEEPEPEKKPFGGIPLPTSFVVIGVILAIYILNALNRGN